MSSPRSCGVSRKARISGSFTGSTVSPPGKRSRLHVEDYYPLEPTAPTVREAITVNANSELLDPIHPGEILLEEFMKPMDISINRLARDLSVPPGRISGIVNGKRGITADTALRLGKYFDVSPQTWMGLQSEYDLRVAQRTIGPDLDKRVHRHAA